MEGGNLFRFRRGGLFIFPRFRVSLSLSGIYGDFLDAIKSEQHAPSVTVIQHEVLET